jgi:hypothetical protein
MQSIRFNLRQLHNLEFIRLVGKHLAQNRCSDPLDKSFPQALSEDGSAIRLSEIFR